MNILKNKAENKPKEKTVKPQAQAEAADAAGSQGAAKPDAAENKGSDITALLQQLVQGVAENNKIQAENSKIQAENKATLQKIADTCAEGNELMQQLLENTKRNGEQNQE